MRYFHLLLLLDQVYVTLWNIKTRLYGQDFEEQQKRLTPLTQRYLYYFVLFVCNWHFDVLYWIEQHTSISSTYLSFLTFPPFMMLVCESRSFQWLHGNVVSAISRILQGVLCLVLVKMLNFLAQYLFADESQNGAVDGAAAADDDDTSSSSSSSYFSSSHWDGGLTRMKELLGTNERKISVASASLRKRNASTSSSCSSSGSSSPRRKKKSSAFKAPVLDYSDVAIAWTKLDKTVMLTLVKFIATVIGYELIHYYLGINLGGASESDKTKYAVELREMFVRKDYGMLLDATTLPKILVVYNGMEQGWLMKKVSQMMRMIEFQFAKLSCYRLSGKIYYLQYLHPHLAWLGYIFVDPDNTITFVKQWWWWWPWLIWSLDLALKLGVAAIIWHVDVAPTLSGGDHLRNYSSKKKKRVLLRQRRQYLCYCWYALVVCLCLETGSMLLILLLLYPPLSVLERVDVTYVWLMLPFKRLEPVYCTVLGIITSLVVHRDINLLHIVTLNGIAFLYLVGYRCWEKSYFQDCITFLLMVIGYYTSWVERSADDLDLDDDDDQDGLGTDLVSRSSAVSPGAHPSHASITTPAAGEDQKTTIVTNVIEFTGSASGETVKISKSSDFGNQIALACRDSNDPDDATDGEFFFG